MDFRDSSEARLNNMRSRLHRLAGDLNTRIHEGDESYETILNDACVQIETIADGIAYVKPPGQFRAPIPGVVFLADAVDPAMDIASREYCVPVSEIRGRLRSVNRSDARHLTWYLVRKLTGAAWVAVGVATGGWNHSSVIYGVQRVKAQMVKNDAVAAFVDRCEAELRAAVGIDDPPVPVAAMRK